jgi:Kdo2-lipid IVA lauroyltransferase/acyltransferase
MREKILKYSVQVISWLMVKWPGDFRMLISIKAFVIGKILRYRRRTVLSNLALTRLEPKDHRVFVNQYYYNITKYIIEILMAVQYDPAAMMKKVMIKDLVKWNKIKPSGSCIVMASHYGNWEINIVALPLLVPQRVVGFYKPISNMVIEKFMLNLRGKHGLELYPIEQTARIMVENKDQDVCYVFISDQSPFVMNNVYWNDFLGTKTPWVTGAEKLAKKYNYPILYLHQIPHNENMTYEVDLSILSILPKSEEAGAITEQYSRILEAEITHDPSHWLWSHKRWKRAGHFSS